jgi:hypothetical protein
MNRGLASDLTPIAETQGLGALISTHRRERPFIRWRARRLWLIVGGLIVGLLWVLYDSGQGYSRYHGYQLYPDGVFFACVVTGYALGFAFAGPIAAMCFPPHGPDRWLALYEHGFIVATRHHVDRAGNEPENDLVVRVVSLSQIQHVEQQSESITELPSGAATLVFMSKAIARVTIEGHGKIENLVFEGYRRQDAFVDALRAKLWPDPTLRVTQALRRTGQTTFGNLVLTKKGLTLADEAGLQPSEDPFLPWREVASVHERDDGKLTIYRTGPSAARAWFRGAVPDVSEAAAAIIKMRNEAL